MDTDQTSPTVAAKPASAARLCRVAPPAMHGPLANAVLARRLREQASELRQSAHRAAQSLQDFRALWGEEAGDYERAAEFVADMLVQAADIEAHAALVSRLTSPMVRSRLGGGL